jgi:hypothetical protein
VRLAAVEILAADFGSDARVRDALARALSSDPDPGVRGWIRQVMGERAP